MPLAPIPVATSLVPEPPRTAPDGFILVEEAITGGLPHTIALAGNVRLTLTLPTGLARTWRDIDPATLVSTSDAERDAPPPHAAGPVGDSRRAPLRIIVEVGQDVVAIVPVVAGRRLAIPDAGDATKGTRIDLMLLRWAIAAGTIRGAGDFGSRISFAWRQANVGHDQFEPPPLHPALMQRLQQGGAQPRS